MILAASLLGQVVGHALREWPLESIGVLSGRVPDRPDQYHELFNIAASPTTRFAVDPNRQIKLWRALADQGSRPLVVCHSHCRIGSTPEPSTTDVDEHDPSLLMMIIGLQAPMTPDVRVYRITDDQAVRVEVTIE